MKTKFSIAFRLGAVACLGLLALPAARATNVISNNAQMTTGFGSIDEDQNGWLAQTFETGAEKLNLNSVSLLLGDASGDVNEPLVVSLYDDNMGQPGSDLADLTSSITSPVTAGSYVYQAGAIPLDTNTVYWIVASTSTVADDGSYRWAFTDSNSVDNPDAVLQNMDANSGWSFDLDNTYATSTDEGDSWSVNSGSPQQFEISASVPEPATWALLGPGCAFLFGVARLRRR